MTIGESSARPVSDKAFSPFKSRSTVIYIFSLFGLLCLNAFCVKAGFYTEVIACISINALVGIMNNVTNHQKTSDAVGSIPTSKAP